MNTDDQREPIDTAELRAKYGRAKYGAYSLWSHGEIEADITALCDALEQSSGTFRTLWREFEATSKRMIELIEEAHTIRAGERAKVAEEIAKAIEATGDEWDGCCNCGPDRERHAAIARQHAHTPAETAATAREGTPASDSVQANPEPAETLSGAKACGCVGKCPTIFKPCPQCGAEVTSVAVDNALATTYRPCGHVVPDGQEGER